jgi:hypothetical protein
VTPPVGFRIRGIGGGAHQQFIFTTTCDRTRSLGPSQTRDLARPPKHEGPVLDREVRRAGKADLSPQRLRNHDPK